MDETGVLKVLNEMVLNKIGALVKDSHIVYTSGKHGTTYINKDAIYLYPERVSELCQVIAEKFKNSNVEVVVAPAVGGVVLSQWTAYHLSLITGGEVLSIYAEKAKNDSHFVIKRGYGKFIRGKNVLIVDDVLTTGGSVKNIIKAVCALGGNIVGLGVICNRGGIKPQDLAKVPELFSLVDIQLEAWDESECPLCAQGMSINTEIGKGREY